VNFLIIPVILLSFVLILPGAFAQNQLESDRDVYIFVQTFVRNSDGVLVHYFENDKFTDKNLAALDVFLDSEASRGNAPEYDLEGKFSFFYFFYCILIIIDKKNRIYVSFSNFFA